MSIQLPPWVWIGAGLLACVAGMVNVVSFIGFEDKAVTHLTGTTSLLGAAIAQGEERLMWHLLGIALAFVLGAMISGVIIQGSTMKLGRRYGIALAVEAVLLIAAVPLFESDHIAGALLAAAAGGLQNAMTTTYSGSVIRTSHVTGLFTDVGIALGHTIRGIQVSRQRLVLFLMVIGCFLLGGIAGAWLFSFVGYRTLYVPAILTGAPGVAYTLYRQRQLWVAKGN